MEFENRIENYKRNQAENGVVINYDNPQIKIMEDEWFLTQIELLKNRLTIYIDIQVQDDKTPNNDQILFINDLNQKKISSAFRVYKAWINEFVLCLSKEEIRNQCAYWERAIKVILMNTN